MGRSVHEMAYRGRDTGLEAGFARAMVDSCGERGHRPWVEEMQVADRLSVWARFDDEGVARPTPSGSGDAHGAARGRTPKRSADAPNAAREKVRSGGADPEGCVRRASDNLAWANQRYPRPKSGK